MAEVLEVDIDEPLLSELADAATLSSMRSDFEKFVPGVTGDFWYEPKEFLKKGTNGQWQDVLPPELVERFNERLVELAGDEMAEWIVGGNNVGGSARITQPASAPHPVPSLLPMPH